MTDPLAAHMLEVLRDCADHGNVCDEVVAGRLAREFNVWLMRRYNGDARAWGGSLKPMSDPYRNEARQRAAMDELARQTEDMGFYRDDEPVERVREIVGREPSGRTGMGAQTRQERMP